MRLLTPEIVAEQLAVSRSTVLRLIADGALPAVLLRRGKTKTIYRVREEVLEKWVKDRETRQPAKMLKLAEG
jgi:excisionase family DNA binding protein